MNTEVEIFFSKAKRWQDEFLLLRNIIRNNTLLVEDYKWMHPCYTFKGKNVVLIHGFKEYCALLFHKGALLTDPKKILIQQTENVQSARQIRFTNTQQIENFRSEIETYIQNAIEIEKQGKKVVLKKADAYLIPDEFKAALAEDHELQTAFYRLTPGRQKAYLFYFDQAKQAKTRQARVEKYYAHILAGKGLDD